MGEARRKRLAREEAYATGKPWPRPTRCPGCGSGETHFFVPGPQLSADLGKIEHGVCRTCGALWEAFPPLYVEDPVCAEPCDNCAFRPGSPEQREPEKWKELIAKLRGMDDYGMSKARFYCHKNVPIDMTAGPGNFLFPTKQMDFGELTPLVPGDPETTADLSKMRTCSGWLRMVWAQNAKRTDNADG